MELRQKQELRKLLVPELNQSLKILSLPLLELKAAIQEEILKNPLLEETQPVGAKKIEASLPYSIGFEGADTALSISLMTKKESLQEILLRQLGMFTNTDEEYKIGYEIIGNIDENGYLKASIEDIAATLQENPLEPPLIVSEYVLVCPVKTRYY